MNCFHIHLIYKTFLVGKSMIFLVLRWRRVYAYGGSRLESKVESGGSQNVIKFIKLKSMLFRILKRISLVLFAFFCEKIRPLFQVIT